MEVFSRKEIKFVLYNLIYKVGSNLTYPQISMLFGVECDTAEIIFHEINILLACKIPVNTC